MAQIYCADISALDPKRLSEVSVYRQNKINSRKIAKDKLRSLGASLLTDIALKEYGLRERDMVYAENEHGKPYFASAPQLHFSISHSGNYAAVMISESECGVDVEITGEPNLNLAARFFHPDETEALNKNSALFYRIWTLKESYIKALGQGFARPLNSFCVIPTQCGFKTEGIERGYNFYEYDIIPGYALSVCTAEKARPTVTVIELK